MTKVLCTLPNASELISGVAFVKHANGMLSEDISDEAAAAFLEIPGYELVGSLSPADPSALAAANAATAEAQARADAEHAAAEKAASDAAAAQALADQKIDLLNRASEIGFKVKANWGVDRLRAEVEAAEKAASGSTGAPSGEGAPTGDASGAPAGEASAA